MKQSLLVKSGPANQLGRATGPPQWAKHSPMQARLKRHDSHISVNMAPRNKKQTDIIFQF